MTDNVRGGMEPQEALVILNPAAGGGRCRQRVMGALERLSDSGWTLDVEETNAPGDGAERAADAWAAGTRRFVAAGGDGTAWEVVSGLMRAGAGDGPDRAWLGFLPGGTGNSFLRDFGDGTLESSLSAMLGGRERLVDVGCLETEGDAIWSLNLLSIGFVADICDTANRRFKRLGELSYVLGLFRQLATLRPIRVRLSIDGGPWKEEELTFLSLNNSRFTGGAMMMAPDADPGDGEVDLVRVAPFGRAALVGVFPRIFKGTHVEDPRVSTERARAVGIRTEGEVAIMVDGEVLRARPRMYRVHPGALRVAVGEPSRERGS